MSERIDETFQKRVALYMLVQTAVFIVLPGVIFVPLADSLNWPDYLYKMPGTLGICFALSWAIACRRQFDYPEAFAVLKTGALWTGIWLGAGLVISVVPQGADELAMSDGDILFSVIFFMVGGMLSGPIVLAFWVFVLQLVWRRA